MMYHLGDDLGAETTMSKMLTNNQRLLKDIGMGKIIRFRDLMEKKGIKDTYLNFMAAPVHILQSPDSD